MNMCPSINESMPARTQARTGRDAADFDLRLPPQLLLLRLLAQQRLFINNTK